MHAITRLNCESSTRDRIPVHAGQIGQGGVICLQIYQFFLNNGSENQHQSLTSCQVACHNKSPSLQWWSCLCEKAILLQRVIASQMKMHL